MAGRPPPPRFVQLRTATRGEPDRDQGSRTITIEQDEDSREGSSNESNVPDFDGVLSLRGGPVHGNRVTWQEGTVDNEFLNRKKSKICCIFHKSKPKTFEDPFAESSSSSSSDDSEDSDSESDTSQCSQCERHNGHDDPNALKSSTLKGKERAKADAESEEATGQHLQDPSREDDHQHTADCIHRVHKHKHRSRRPKPNAYEHQPRYGKAKKKRDKGSSTMTITEQPHSASSHTGPAT